jgi:hypothetical protein
MLNERVAIGQRFGSMPPGTEPDDAYRAVKYGDNILRGGNPADMSIAGATALTQRQSYGTWQAGLVVAVRSLYPSQGMDRLSAARHQGGVGFTHDITSGLFAGARPRQVADDPSFGYIAAFLALPQ